MKLVLVIIVLAASVVFNSCSLEQPHNSENIEMIKAVALSAALHRNFKYSKKDSEKIIFVDDELLPFIVPRCQDELHDRIGGVSEVAEGEVVEMYEIIDVSVKGNIANVIIRYKNVYGYSDRLYYLEYDSSWQSKGSRLDKMYTFSY